MLFHGTGDVFVVGTWVVGVISDKKRVLHFSKILHVSHSNAFPLLLPSIFLHLGLGSVSLNLCDYHHVCCIRLVIMSCLLQNGCHDKG